MINWQYIFECVSCIFQNFLKALSILFFIASLNDTKTVSAYADRATRKGSLQFYPFNFLPSSIRSMHRKIQMYTLDIY